MDYLNLAKNVLTNEAEALVSASKNLDKDTINNLVELFGYLKSGGGSLVFCGVGKSGIVARKLSSTFTSLGLSSWFLHPTEALHGDLGRLQANDALVIISKSGITEEIVKLLPFIELNKKVIVGLLGNTNSKLAKSCGIVFDCSVKCEACINNMAPTTSSTLSLAMGDALAVIYESMIGLSQEGFAYNHPGGMLGKIMRFKVSDLMWDIDECPYLPINSTLQDVVLIMTRKNVGGCAIVNDSFELLGIIVEGDIRRTLLKSSEGINTPVAQIMNSKPISITPDTLAFDAISVMEKKDGQIYILPVVENNKFLGFIRLHDLIKEGFIKKEN